MPLKDWFYKTNFDFTLKQKDKEQQQIPRRNITLCMELTHIELQ